MGLEIAIKCHVYKEIDNERKETIAHAMEEIAAVLELLGASLQIHEYRVEEV